MRGFTIKSMRIETVLLEQFNEECRKREDIEGYVEPNINDFLDFALERYTDEYFKQFPIIYHERR